MAPRSGKWTELETLVLSALAAGPKTTRELKDLASPAGYTENQISQLISAQWMDLPRLPGKTMYEPWTVFHPRDARASELGISRAVDDWLITYMAATDRAVLTIQVRTAAEAAGYTGKDLTTAYRRCGVTAFKKGKHWYRSKP